MRVDDARGRHYTIDGCEYPSVTTIISAISKPALTNWAASVEREMVIAESFQLYENLSKARIPLLSSTKWALNLQERLGKERANRKILRQASEIGSQAHAMIEWTLRNMMCEKQGPSPSIGEKATWAFTQWLKWKDSVRLKPILIEKNGTLSCVWIRGDNGPACGSERGTGGGGLEDGQENLEGELVAEYSL